MKILVHGEIFYYIGYCYEIKRNENNFLQKNNVAGFRFLVESTKFMTFQIFALGKNNPREIFLSV